MTNTALAVVSTQTPQLVKLVDVLPLETAAELETAAGVLRNVKTLINALEAERKELVAPIKAEASAIDARYREPRKALQSIEGKIKARIGEAHARHEAERTAALEAASAAAVAGDTGAAAEAITAAAAPAPSTEGVSVRYRWAPMLVDATKVPREYLTVDTAKLTAIAKAHGNGPTPPVAVPGIEWNREPIVSARGR